MHYFFFFFSFASDRLVKKEKKETTNQEPVTANPEMAQLMLVYIVKLITVSIEDYVETNSTYTADSTYS